MEKITSLQNAKVKKWVRLHEKKERDKTNLFLIEGEHLIEEALKENIVETIITDIPEKVSFPDSVAVTSEIMKKISANVSAVHYIAVVRKPQKEIISPSRILMLDDVQDPGNLGTLVRTAVSFGFSAIYCSKGTVDLYNEKVIRSTQGALFHIPVVYADLAEEIQKYKEQGFEIIATSLHDAEPMEKIRPSEKMVFILGNEGQGVSKPIMDLSDQRLYIEMKEFESLNVAVAGGIVMYHFMTK